MESAKRRVESQEIHNPVKTRGRSIRSSDDLDGRVGESRRLTLFGGASLEY